ncbi:MAG: hypothetical protein M9962_11985 [Oligoflexia bacterium]|nr:hypothetical protein [Oligoflexia bacterium]
MILIISLLLTQLSLALSLSCETDIPSTGIYLNLVDDEYQLEIQHYSGLQYIPYYRGIVRPSLLNRLNEDAKILQSLGTSYTFRFPKNECSLVSDGIISCMNGKKKTINGQEVSAFALDTQTVDYKTFAGSYSRQLVHVFLVVNSRSIHMEAEYLPGNCYFGKERD